jgi:DNA helicase-2/ATP-dependent DNA helicase PcrA
MRREPNANVALIARYPAQAELYYQGLKRADIPYLRRVADQDFAFARAQVYLVYRSIG